MSDITREDLRRVVRGRTYKGVEYVTDEEFDRLAREAGYVKVTEDQMRALVESVNSGSRPIALSWMGRNPAEALRVLLTDECEACGGQGTVTDPRATEASWLEGTQEMLCPDCGGRDWLPKERVQPINICDDDWPCDDHDGLWIPFDWLEAEDE